MSRVNEVSANSWVLTKARVPIVRYVKWLLRQMPIVRYAKWLLRQMPTSQVYERVTKAGEAGSQVCAVVTKAGEPIVRYVQWSLRQMPISRVCGRVTKAGKPGSQVRVRGMRTKAGVSGRLQALVGRRMTLD